MKNQDCDLCFYKFCSAIKKEGIHCSMYKERVEDCNDFKNDIMINGNSYNFINPIVAEKVKCQN